MNAKAECKHKIVPCPAIQTSIRVSVRPRERAGMRACVRVGGRGATSSSSLSPQICAQLQLQLGAAGNAPHGRAGR